MSPVAGQCASGNVAGGVGVNVGGASGTHFRFVYTFAPLRSGALERNCCLPSQPMCRRRVLALQNNILRVFFLRFCSTLNDV